MDFYNKLKGVLGISSYNRNDNNSTDASDHRNDSETKLADDYEQFGFNVFSSPVEMHRYFEHQMNEIMKNFGIFNNDIPFFGNDEHSPFFDFGFTQFPEEHDLQRTPTNGNLRDNFLKPGYEDPSNKKDSDLDEQYRSGDFNRTLVPKSELPSRTFTFGRSMINKTITNSDGITEMHKIVQDENGNREETVTRKFGDKEYCITTRTDNNGVQEVTENFVNIDESEKDIFCKSKNSPMIHDQKEKQFEDFMFNKFFRL